jgi:Short C-terminal domain
MRLNQGGVSVHNGVSVTCPNCSQDRVFEIRDSDTWLACPSGHMSDFVRCTSCHAYFQSPREGRRQPRIPCPQCGATDRPQDVRAGDAEWVNAEHLQTPDKDRRTLYHLTLAASGGSSLATGSECTVVFAVEGVRITSRGQVENVAYDQIIALEVGGGTTRSGGGFIGGGFGVTGAVEGMLAASVLNSLTSRTQINTILRLATPASEYIFLSHATEVAALRLALTPVQPRIRQAQVVLQSQPPTATGTPLSVADELGKLAQLRDNGVLSDTEFASAKARLLGM